MEDETTRATAEGLAETMSLDKKNLASIIDRVADKLKDTQSAGTSSKSRKAEDRRASAGPSSSGLGKLVNRPSQDPPPSSLNGCDLLEGCLA